MITARNIEIIQLLAEGLKLKDIAGQLSISRRTVETHIETCRKRLHAKNTTHLVAICFRNELIK